MPISTVVRCTQWGIIDSKQLNLIRLETSSNPYLIFQVISNILKIQTYLVFSFFGMLNLVLRPQLHQPIFQFFIREENEP